MMMTTAATADCGDHCRARKRRRRLVDEMIDRGTSRPTDRQT